MLALPAFNIKFNQKDKKMRQSFKNTLQPLEKALKKAFGIRKERKGQIFDSRGFANDSREKITRFVLFIPLFQKIRVLISANSLWGGGNRKILMHLNLHFTR